ncbi:MAG TPA: diphthine--ammonia ligase [Chitinophagaceae bacterium]|nr:diphthine--ammonia ligase [Chitinophagaceae bacterium]
MVKNSLCSWSGGKDSCFALMQSVLLGYTPKVLLNVLNEEGKISRSHGIPYSIMRSQADVAKLPLHCISSSWQEYEMHFTNALKELKDKFQVTHAVFGDIDLQEHRDWEEKVCAHSGLTAVLPLWKQNRKALVLQMLEAGIESIIVSCNEKMGERFIGRPISTGLVMELESMGIDPCGENGEYHTLVLDCPLFSSAIDVHITEKLIHDNYWFGKLEPALQP